MRKLFFILIAIFFGSEILFSQNLVESAIIITGKRVFTKDNKIQKSARSFSIKSFNDFKPSEQYIVDGELFTDDGKYNDLTAGDGIYTSIELRSNLANDIDPSNIYFVSEAFKYKSELETYISALKIKFGCKVKYTTEGTTVLGNSCKSGCLHFYDCELSVEFGW